MPVYLVKLSSRSDILKLGDMAQIGCQVEKPTYAKS